MTNKQKAIALLESLQSGDTTPLSYIHPKKYIQHNFILADGIENFEKILKNNQGFELKVIRAFEDGNYVFTHSEYNLFSPKIGFDIFRFEEGLIVEHWDNLIEIQPKNPSGRSQIDGNTDITDLDKTNENKKIIKNFLEDIFYKKQKNITDYINPNKYLQHNPSLSDGIEEVEKALKPFDEKGLEINYQKTHIILGEGNFVLAVSEGKMGKEKIMTFYDLFRLENSKIIEHWDVIEPLTPKENWKNENGKFGF